jgi:hypothetical protein
LIERLALLGCEKNTVVPTGTPKLRQSRAEWLVPAPLVVTTVVTVPAVWTTADPCNGVSPESWANAVVAKPQAQAAPAAARTREIGKEGGNTILPHATSCKGLKC